MSEEGEDGCSGEGEGRDRWSMEGEDGCSGEGEGRDRWSVEGEDEEHGVEMGQSDGDVLTCTACHFEQQGYGTGLSGGGVALQSPVMKAGGASDCGTAVPCAECWPCIRLPASWAVRLALG